MSEAMPRIESQPADDVEVRRAEAIADAFKAATAFLDSMNKADGVSLEEKEWARTQAMGILASLGNTLPVSEAADVTPATIGIAPEPIESASPAEEVDAPLEYNKGDQVKLMVNGKPEEGTVVRRRVTNGTGDEVVAVSYKRGGKGAKYMQFMSAAELDEMQGVKDDESTELSREKQNIANDSNDGPEESPEERAQAVLDMLETSQPTDNEDEGSIAPEPVIETPKATDEEPDVHAYKQNDAVKVRLPGDNGLYDGRVLGSTIDDNGHEWVEVMYTGSNGEVASEPMRVPAAALKQMQESKLNADEVLSAAGSTIAEVKAELKKDEKSRWGKFKDWFNAKSGLVYEGAREKIRRHPKAVIGVGVVAVGLLLLSRDSFNSGDHSSLLTTDAIDRTPMLDGGHTEIVHVTDAGNAVAEAVNIPDGAGGEDMMKALKLDPNTWYAHENDFAKKFPNLTYRMSDGHIGLVDTSVNGGTSRYSGAVRDWWQNQR